MSVTVPAWVRAELERSGGLSQVTREVLEAWARKEGGLGATSRTTAIQTAARSLDRADAELQASRKAIADARASLADWLPKAEES